MGRANPLRPPFICAKLPRLARPVVAEEFKALMSTPAPSTQRSRLWRLIRAVILILLTFLILLLLALVLLGLLPPPVENPVVSNPAADYADALARIEASQAEEKALPDFNPICGSILMTHGHKTADAIVFYHGFTNCPEQYRLLAQEFFDRGYNVYVPLTPYHGRNDRRGQALVNLTANSLAAYATATADAAQGLGERVTVSGLSGGGTVAAWLAQERADIALSAPSSPFIGVSFLPGAFLNRGLANLLRFVPNVSIHWDPVTRLDNPNTAAHAYAAYPIRSMGTYMQLGLATMAAARTTPPAAGAIRMILNDADFSVNNRVAAELVARWQRAGAADVTTFTFARDMYLPHDFIAPERVGASLDEVYATLIELMTGAVGR